MRIALACVLALMGWSVLPASADVITATKVVADAHRVHVISAADEVLMPKGVCLTETKMPEDVSRLVAAAHELVRWHLDELSRLLGVCLPTKSILGGGCFEHRGSFKRGGGARDLDGGHVAVSPSGPSAVPEPASVALTATALAGLALRRRRRRP